jgi:hypothetical protein
MHCVVTKVELVALFVAASLEPDLMVIQQKAVELQRERTTKHSIVLCLAHSEARKHQRGHALHPTAAKALK